MFKTGTSSLGRAFELLGYRHSPDESWYRNKIMDDPWNSHPELWPQYMEIILARVREMDALQDYPWMFLFKEMDAAFPGSRFIYTARDPERVVQSNRNHWRSRGAPEEKIPSRERILQRYLNHQKSVFEYFNGRSDLLIMNLEEGSSWKELCEFLGEPVPDEPFPHINRGEYKPDCHAP